MTDTIIIDGLGAGSAGPAGVNWRDEGWQVGRAFSILDGVAHNGASYRARVNHAAEAGDEPGVGAGWQDKWRVIAARGATGVGEPGPVPVITATVATGAAGSSASVTTSGPAATPTLAFTLPRGDKGDDGDPGPTGPMAPMAIPLTNNTGPFIAAENVLSIDWPVAMNVTHVYAVLATPQTSGALVTVDIKRNGASILPTRITIDNGERRSSTAAAPPVLASSPVALAVGDTVSFDIDQVGDGSARGLVVYLATAEIAWP